MAQHKRYVWDPWWVTDSPGVTLEPPEPSALSDLPSVSSNFLWGAATAGIQVEGNLPYSDWAFFSSSESIRKRVRWQS